MFIKILKGDIKKKKGQSLAIVALLCLSLSLLIASVQLIYSSSVQISDFMSQSKIASVIIWKTYNKNDNEKILELSTNTDFIDSVTILDALSVKSDDIHVGADANNIPTSLSLFLSTYDNENNLVFDMNDNSNLALGEGEIAIPLYLSKLTNINIGDLVEIHVGGNAYSFIVKDIFKDVLFGNEYISTKRILLNNTDLKELLGVSSENQHSSFVSFSLNTGGSTAKLISEYNNAGLEQQFSIDKDLLMQIYQSSNGMIAAIFLLAALFISLICFIIQRYSIQSTLQNEYPQIALMKATGFRLSQIRSIYVVKYTAIGFLGSLFGLLLGLALSFVATKDYLSYIVVTRQWNPILLSVLCACLVWLIFFLVAYLYMNKIKRYSPVEMANSRQTEIKRPLFPIRLYQSKSVDPRVGIAINDIVNQPKSYIKFVATLAICSTLVISAYNLKTTIQSNELINYFGLTVGDIYTNISVENHERTALIKHVDSLSQELAEKNESVTLGIDFYLDAYILDDTGSSSSITALKSALLTEQFKFIEGTAPTEKNEIALTTVLMNRYQKKVGDTIVLEIEGERQEFVITASNQALYNMGEIILLPNSYEIISDRISYQVIAFVGTKIVDSAQYINYLQSEYDFLQGATADQIISAMTGSMVDQIAMSVDLLLFIILFFICLVTALFIKLICMRDIDKMKSLRVVGLNNSYLLSYQTIRVSIVIVLSLIIGCILSVTLGRELVSFIFAMTGLAKFDLVFDFLNTFIILPLAFFIVTTVVSVIVHKSDNNRNLNAL